MWPNVVFLAASAVCGVTDYKRYIIPNAVTVPLIVAGLAMQLCFWNWKGLLFALLASAFFLVIASVTGGMGGGDVKLMAAMFLWLNPADCLNIIIIACAIGIAWGVLRKARALGLKGFYRFYIEKIVLLNAFGIRNAEGFQKGEAVPFGTCTAIAAAAYFAFIYPINL